MSLTRASEFDDVCGGSQSDSEVVDYGSDVGTGRYGQRDLKDWGSSICSDSLL